MRTAVIRWTGRMAAAVAAVTTGRLALAVLKDGWRGAAGHLVEWSAAASDEEPERVFAIWLVQAATLLARDLLALTAWAAFAQWWTARPPR